MVYLAELPDGLSKKFWNLYDILLITSVKIWELA